MTPVSPPLALPDAPSALRRPNPHRPHARTPLGPAPCARLAPRARATLVLALLFLAWEAAGADLWLAQLAGDAQGFALREHWLLSNVLHGGARALAWLLALGLALGVWWPLGPLRRLDGAQRVQLLAGVLLGVALVSLLKGFSPAACPWSLAQFGGHGQPVSHWLMWARPAGGGGGCFPAGHASAGYAFVGGYFVFKPVDARLARRWLQGALGAGLLLGLAQQWRGAHFMSHTLWSGWLCWSMAWALDAACRRRTARTAAPRGQGG